MALRVNVATLLVAASYMTLVVYDADGAERLYVPYAVVIFVLALVGVLAVGRRRHRHD